MDKVEIPRERADFWVVKLCDEVDARASEHRRIRGRFPVLALAGFVCLCGISAIVQGKDAELVRQFGELASVVSFFGLPVSVGWIIRDWMRTKAIPREDAATETDLARRGYEYVQGCIYRTTHSSESAAA